MWDLVATESPDIRAKAVEKINIHNEWFLKQVLRDGPKGPSDTVILVPHFFHMHRDEYKRAPSERVYNGFDSNHHASFAGVPEFVFPIGQIDYTSPISKRMEFVPVAASIIGPKNSDIMLMNLISKTLTENNRPDCVLPGRSAFPMNKTANSKYHQHPPYGATRVCCGPLWVDPEIKGASQRGLVAEPKQSIPSLESWSL